MDSIAEALELAAAEGTRQQVRPCMLTLQTRCAVPGRGLPQMPPPMTVLVGWPSKGMHVGQIFLQSMQGGVFVWPMRALSSRPSTDMHAELVIRSA